MINPNSSITQSELQDLRRNNSRRAISTYIVSKLWRIATVDPRQTGGKISAQRNAFRLLLDIQGAVEFLTRRPKAELAALGQHGICSANLHGILRELVSVCVGAIKRGRRNGASCIGED